MQVKYKILESQHPWNIKILITNLSNKIINNKKSIPKS